MSQTVTTCETFTSCSDTPIKVKKHTGDRLKNLGNLSYTYDKFIAELLDEYDEKNK